MAAAVKSAVGVRKGRDETGQGGGETGDGKVAGGVDLAAMAHAGSHLLLSEAHHSILLRLEPAKELAQVKGDPFVTGRLMDE